MKLLAVIEAIETWLSMAETASLANMMIIVNDNGHEKCSSNYGFEDLCPPTP